MLLKRPRVVVYAGVTYDREMIAVLHREILLDDGFIGCLYSYACFKNQDLTDLRLFSYYPSFADCGAFSERSDPDFFHRNTIGEMVSYYERNKFYAIAEPDYYSNNVESALLVGGFRTQIFYKYITQINSTWKPQIVRPIHGSNMEQRIEYIDRLNKMIDRPTDYYAIGNIKDHTQAVNLADLEKTAEALRDLKENSGRRIHFFSPTSKDAIDFAVKLASDFDQVTLDGTSWSRLAFSGRTLYFFTGEGMLLLRFHRNTTENKVAASIEVLKTCDCPACKSILFKAEGNRFVAMTDLAKSSWEENPFFAQLFIRKAQIHNLYHQRKYLIWKYRKTFPKDDE